MPMIWEGVCQKCSGIVEFFSSKADRDAARTHADTDSDSACDGQVLRRPYATGLAVRWKYGKNDKKGCFMGPSNNIYKTDTTEKSRRAKTKIVSGPAYSGACNKDKQ